MVQTGEGGTRGELHMSSSDLLFDRRAHVVEPDPAVKATIRKIITAAGIYSDEFTFAEEFLEGQEARSTACIVANLVLPGIGGLELIHRLRQSGREDPVILISDARDVASAVAGVHAGALDVIERHALGDRLVDAVRRALEQLQAIDQNRRDNPIYTLSPRERQVLVALSDGSGNQTVAAKLGLSVRTVEMHRGSILRKLGVDSMIQAVLRAKQAGLA